MNNLSCQVVGASASELFVSRRALWSAEPPLVTPQERRGEREMVAETRDADYDSLAKRVHLFTKYCVDSQSQNSMASN